MHLSTLRRMSGWIMVIGLMLVMGVMVQAQRVTVVHLHDNSHNPQWTEWLRQSKAKFEAANPDIEIELMIHGRAQQKEKLILLYGTGSHPDVTEVFPTDYYTFALEGMFQDLGPWLDQDPVLDMSQFYPVAAEASVIIDGHPRAGQIWMLPVSLFVTGAAINDSHLQEAASSLRPGLDINGHGVSSQTWEES